MSVVLILVTFVVALVGTASVRVYALKRRIIDVPNDRSSHSLPVPRGGGVAIVVSYSAGLLVLMTLGDVPANILWALLGAGCGAAAIGFLDDHGHVAARWRLLAHFTCASWALAWVGGLPVLAFGSVHVDLGWLGYLFAALFLVWMLNLYNFMDGIDGIASVQSICMALGGATLYYLAGYPAYALMILLLASATAGFLVWNFPPARIFMGDAGSGFLGIVIGVISLHAGSVNISFLWAFLILSGVFITDATLTLFRRALRRDPVYVAHRSHAYQHATQKFGRHLPVTLGVLAINLCWLMPWALLVGLGIVDAHIGLAMAYSPLVILAFQFKVGKPETLWVSARPAQRS